MKLLDDGVGCRYRLYNLCSHLLVPVLQENLGVLQTGEDLLKLLDYGMRGGQNRYFTYVLMSGSLRFSETGAAFLADMMSKHAMHSGCAEQVESMGRRHAAERPELRFAC